MNTSKGFRIARVNKDVTQGEAAKGLDISANYLSLIETGDRTPSMKLLKRAQVYYNVPMSVLLHEESEYGRNPQPRPIDESGGEDE